MSTHSITLWNGTETRNASAARWFFLRINQGLLNEVLQDSHIWRSNEAEARIVPFGLNFAELISPCIGGYIERKGGGGRGKGGEG